MSSYIKKLSPYLLIVLGLLLLFFMDQAIPAGVCFLIGFVMIVEKIWPEKWETENYRDSEL